MKGDGQSGPQIALFSDGARLVAAKLTQVVAAAPVAPFNRVVCINLEDKIGAAIIVALQFHGDEGGQGRAALRKLHLIVYSPIRAAQQLVSALDRT